MEINSKLDSANKFFDTFVISNQDSICWEDVLQTLSKFPQSVIEKCRNSFTTLYTLDQNTRLQRYEFTTKFEGSSWSYLSLIAAFIIADEDKDQKLNFSEFEKCLQFMCGEIPSDIQEHFNEIDQDKDGYITPDEFLDTLYVKPGTLCNVL